nr:MAG: putative RNA-dependent RNA polymerase [Jiangsu picobirnavirus 87]
MYSKQVGRFINQHFVDTSSSVYFTEDGYQNVQTYFGNLVKGQPKIWTAPFAKGQSMNQILKDWQSVLVSLQDKWPTLCEFENDLAKKVGPLSVQLPLRDRMDDIRHYWDDILLPSKPIDSQAIDAVCGEFRKIQPLSPRSQRNTVEKMKLSTQAGSPFWMKRRDVIKDSYPCRCTAILGTRYIDMDVLQALPSFVGDACAVVGWRGQEGGPSKEDVKQRVIWMFPFAVNIQELQLYQPLIEGCQRHNLVPAWVSMESVDKSITNLFDTKRSDDLIVCTDFSKFDQHFNSTMQGAAKSILTALCTNNSDARNWLKFVFPIKYQIPLLWEVETNGERNYVSVLKGLHGMASGSGGTNADETLAHRALQYEVAFKHGQVLNPNSQCLGDDGILSYPGITVEDVVDAYSSHGQECNVDKQYASTQDCIYLRRWHHNRYRVNGICVGVYSTCRALGRLRYLERFMNPEYWSSELVALRQLSIIENCKWHPLFEQFIQFCMKRDKFRLGKDIPGFLDNITDKAMEAIDHMPDFLGYTKTLQGEGPEGIADWAVVKYLKSVR